MTVLGVVLAAVVVVVVPVARPAGAAAVPVISTYSGGLGSGIATNVGQAPARVVVDAEGTTYVTDTFFNVVRRISADGDEDVFAGTGEVGYTGDGGLATNATLALRLLDGVNDPPPGLAVSPGGDLYIADTHNHVIRKVSSSGVITTVMGTGVAGSTFAAGAGPTDIQLTRPAGIAFDDNGDMVVADTGNHRVLKVFAACNCVNLVVGSGLPGNGPDNGPATAAQVNTPTAVDFHEGALFIADAGNCRIRKVVSGTLTTVAGGSGCTFSGDGGSATAARLKDPVDVGVLSDGSFVIADRGNCAIRRVDAAGAISTVAGVGATCGLDEEEDGAPPKKLDAPSGVAVSNSGVLIADRGNLRLRRLAGTTLSTAAGNGRVNYSGDGGAATGAQHSNPIGVAVAKDGSIFVSDAANHVVRKIDPEGNVSTVAGDGTRMAGYNGDDILAITAKLSTPRGLAVDDDGNLYIADEGNCRIRRVDDQTGEISTVAGKPGTCVGSGSLPDLDTNVALDHPHDVALDGSGAIFVANTNDHTILKVADGIVTRVAGTSGDAGNTGDGGAATSATLSEPHGVAVDADGIVYIADTLNNRVRKVEDGTISAFAGDGSSGLSGNGGPADEAKLRLPRDVAVDTDGVVYVADSLNHAIRTVASGTIAAFTGTGFAGFSGDGEVPGGAQLNLPQGVTAGKDGTVFVADSLNNRVRRIGIPPPTVPGAPVIVSAVAGNGTVTVSWDPPADDGGAEITEYTVAAYIGSTEGPVVPVGGNVLTATVTGLTNGTGYTLRVSATNAVGTSLPSEPSPVVTPAAPVVPAANVASGSSGPGGSGSSGAAGAPVRVGYWMLGEPGKVFAFGDAAHAGDAAVGAVPANDIEASPSGNGYWVVDAQGHVFAFGDAGYHGGFSSLQPGEAVTSLSATPSGKGYRLFTSHGRVAAFGDADHLGDMAGTKLNGPVLDSTTTPSGRGYYMVASDGGVFTFGDAVFRGSMGHTRLNQPVQSLTSDPDGTGYWLVASDGGIFSFEAEFYGSMGQTPLNKPITGMVPFGRGYLMVAEDGGIFTFGDAVFRGSLGASPPPFPITAVAALR